MSMDAGMKPTGARMASRRNGGRREPATSGDRSPEGDRAAVRSAETAR